MEIEIEIEIEVEMNPCRNTQHQSRKTRNFPFTSHGALLLSVLAGRQAASSRATSSAMDSKAVFCFCKATMPTVFLPFDLRTVCPPSLSVVLRGCLPRREMVTFSNPASAWVNVAPVSHLTSARCRRMTDSFWVFCVGGTCETWQLAVAGA